MKILATTILLLLAMSVTMPTFADEDQDKSDFDNWCETNQNSKNFDADYFMCNVWNYQNLYYSITNLGDYIKVQLSPQVDANTQAISTLQNSTQSNDISNDPTIVALTNRIVTLEDLVIPDFDKLSIIKSYSISYDEESHTSHLITLDIEIESFHDGGQTTVMFLDPSSVNSDGVLHWMTPHYSTNPDMKNGDNLGNSLIIHERGIEQYSFSYRYGDTFQGETVIRLSGDINKDFQVKLPTGY